jgi:uncharacterized protein (DUF1499 family)
MRRRPWLRRILLLVLVGLIGFGVYVRVLPTTASLWHQPSYPSGIGHLSGPNSHTWRAAQKADARAQMAQINAVILETPRTQAIGGSVDEGMITYITRSRWWKFPDFTTLERDVALIEGGPRVISIYSRAQFGSSDLGVNRRRLQKWLIQLEVGG